MIIEIGPNLLQALTSVDKLVFIATVIALMVVGLSRSVNKK